MCMKHVNADVKLYAGILYAEDKSIEALVRPFCELTAKKETGGQYSLMPFSIVSRFNILGKPNGQSESLFDGNTKLDIIIRLAKVGAKPTGQPRLNLTKFEIDLTDLKSAGEDCTGRKFLSYVHISEIRVPIMLQETGDYVIKVLVKTNKEPADDPYLVQSINPLKINAPK